MPSVSSTYELLSLLPPHLRLEFEKLAQHLEFDFSNLSLERTDSPASLPPLKPGRDSPAPVSATPPMEVPMLERSPSALDFLSSRNTMGSPPIEDSAFSPISRSESSLGLNSPSPTAGLMQFQKSSDMQRDQMTRWRLKKFYDQNPPGRMEALKLSGALDKMVLALRTSSPVMCEEDRLNNIMEIFPLVSLILDEITRHVALHCIERGQLLDKLTAFLKEALIENYEKAIRALPTVRKLRAERKQLTSEVQRLELAYTNLTKKTGVLLDKTKQEAFDFSMTREMFEQKQNELKEKIDVFSRSAEGLQKEVGRMENALAFQQEINDEQTDVLSTLENNYEKAQQVVKEHMEWGSKLKADNERLVQEKNELRQQTLKQRRQINDLSTKVEALEAVIRRRKEALAFLNPDKPTETTSTSAADISKEFLLNAGRMSPPRPVGTSLSPGLSDVVDGATQTDEPYPHSLTSYRRRSSTLSILHKRRNSKETRVVNETAVQKLVREQSSVNVLKQIENDVDDKIVAAEAARSEVSFEDKRRAMRERAMIRQSQRAQQKIENEKKSEEKDGKQSNETGNDRSAPADAHSQSDSLQIPTRLDHAGSISIQHSEGSAVAQRESWIKANPMLAENDISQEEHAELQARFYILQQELQVSIDDLRYELGKARIAYKKETATKADKKNIKQSIQELERLLSAKYADATTSGLLKSAPRGTEEDMPMEEWSLDYAPVYSLKYVVTKSVTPSLAETKEKKANDTEGSGSGGGEEGDEVYDAPVAPSGSLRVGEIVLKAVLAKDGSVNPVNAARVRAEFPLRFLNMMACNYSHRPPKTIAWVVRAIYTLYDDKVVADAALSVSNNTQTTATRVPMPEFTYEWACQRFGMRQLVEHYCWDLYLSCSEHRDSSREIAIFLKFLSEEYELKYLSFFLYCRTTLQKYITFDANTPPLVSYPVMAAVIGRAFDSCSDALRTTIMNQTKALMAKSQHANYCIEALDFLELMLDYYREEDLNFDRTLRQLFEKGDENGDDCLQEGEFIAIVSKFLPQWGYIKLRRLFLKAIHYNDPPDDTALSFAAFERIAKEHDFFHETFQMREVFSLLGNKPTVDSGKLLSVTTVCWSGFSSQYESMLKEVIENLTHDAKKNFSDLERFLRQDLAARLAVESSQSLRRMLLAISVMQADLMADCDETMSALLEEEFAMEVKLIQFRYSRYRLAKSKIAERMSGARPQALTSSENSAIRAGAYGRLNPDAESDKKAGVKEIEEKEDEEAPVVAPVPILMRRGTMRRLPMGDTLQKPFEDAPRPSSTAGKESADGSNENTRTRAKTLMSVFRSISMAALAFSPSSKGTGSKQEAEDSESDSSASDEG